MSLRPRQYKDEDNFVHNFAPKTNEEKDFSAVDKPVKKKRSEASKKLLHDEAKRLRDEERQQLLKMMTMLEEQGKILKQLVDSDKKVHEAIPEVKPEDIKPEA